jgi:hypothetical protein
MYVFVIYSIDGCELTYTEKIYDAGTIPRANNTAVSTSKFNSPEDGSVYPKHVLKWMVLSAKLLCDFRS